MIRRPPRSTRTDTLFPYTTLFRSLRVLRARPRDVAQRLAGLARIAITGKIGDRHDADEALVAVDYRQTANLDIAHIIEHIIDVLVVKTIFDLIAHHLADNRLGPAPGGNATDSDRSDERRLGIDVVSTCSARGTPYHEKKNTPY